MKNSSTFRRRVKNEKFFVVKIIWQKERLSTGAHTNNKTRNDLPFIVVGIEFKLVTAPNNTDADFNSGVFISLAVYTSGVSVTVAVDSNRLTSKLLNNSVPFVSN